MRREKTPAMHLFQLKSELVIEIYVDCEKTSSKLCLHSVAIIINQNN